MSSTVLRWPEKNPCRVNNRVDNTGAAVVDVCQAVRRCRRNSHACRKAVPGWRRPRTVPMYGDIDPLLAASGLNISIKVAAGFCYGDKAEWACWDLPGSCDLSLAACMHAAAKRSVPTVCGGGGGGAIQSVVNSNMLVRSNGDVLFDEFCPEFKAFHEQVSTLRRTVSKTRSDYS